MLCNALLFQGHGSWPQPEESGMDPWQSLEQAGSGHLGSQKTRSRTCCSSQAGDREHNSDNLHCLSTSHVCRCFLPKFPQQACEHHQLLPHTQPSFFQPVWPHKNKHFSFLSLNPDFQGNSVFYISLFNFRSALHCSSWQVTFTFHSYSICFEIPNIKGVCIFVLIILQCYFTTEA